MTDNHNNEIWVFLSHSNKDYEKVRQVRNMLEEQSLRPLMFFLHCLNDDDEIDSLIKREIDCRTRFILCDSENARKSHWVQKEVEYIKSQNRVCETIDLSQSIDEIMMTLQDFINKTRIFISYNREEYQLADMVYNRLSRLDFSVYIDRAWDFNNAYRQNYADALNFLEESVVKSNGYVVAIMNERALSPASGLHYEITKAIRENRSIDKDAPNIIPFALSNMVAYMISEDADLKPMVKCGIQVLERQDNEGRCDEIVKRVVTQLMTPGSIKVLADNLAKGTYREADSKEADFLCSFLKPTATNILRSESGMFYVDNHGIVQRFEPAINNPLVEIETEVKDSYVSKAYKSIRTFVVPEGVKGFASDFLRGLNVVERFELPKSLVSIGNNSSGNEENHCVFADCVLPEVIIPANVKEIGIFAFGHSHINSLQLPATLLSPYGRQFKDSHIGTLRLPREWKEHVSLSGYNSLVLSESLCTPSYGYLRWPSTSVERLEFY